MHRSASGALAVLLLFLAAAGAWGLDESERIGKVIYLRGESPREEPISALLGDPPLRVSATVLPCANCHGDDGRGRPEGGVIPSDLSWEKLVRSYGSTTGTGRRHRPYDEASFARAIREGIDPSGNPLNAAMVRYEISDEAISDLIAYLRIIDRDVDPGVDDTSIRIATIVPEQGPLAAVGEGIRRVLEARFAERADGVFGRRIDVVALELPAERKDAIVRLEASIAESEPFLIASPLVPGLEAELRALAERRGIPVIAPVVTPEERDDGDAPVFHLTPSTEDQWRALLDDALDGLSREGRLRIICPSGTTPLVTLLADRARSRGIEPSVEGADGHGTAPPFLAPSRDRVLFLGAGAEAAAWLARAEREGGLPERLSLLGSSIDDALFRAPRGARIHAALPNSAALQGGEAREAHRALLERLGIARPAAPFTNADAAATLVLRALDESGRSLRRSGVIRSLEGCYRVELGLVPPATFGPGRRIAARGASIVRVDLEGGTLVPVDPWHEVRR